MANPSTKATRRSLDSVVDQTLRLLQEVPEPWRVRYITCNVEFDQDVEHERARGLDVGAKAKARLIAGAPVDAAVDVGIERDSQRSGKGGVTGRFKFRIELPGKG